MRLQHMQSKKAQAVKQSENKKTSHTFINYLKFLDMQFNVYV